MAGKVGQAGRFNVVAAPTGRWLVATVMSSPPTSYSLLNDSLPSSGSHGSVPLCGCVACSAAKPCRWPSQVGRRARVVADSLVVPGFQWWWIEVWRRVGHHGQKAERRSRTEWMEVIGGAQKR